MLRQSLADSGSTDMASEHHERSFIDADIEPKAQTAKYASLPTDEHATSHQAPTASWFDRITLDTWVPEIIALFISAASIIAITAILKYYDSTKSPELPYGITLNAIVSILATVSRSMLIFTVTMCIGQLKWCWYHEQKRKVVDIQKLDAASRGPLGSAILLFSLRMRPLASFGAVITILTLAFDPFIQQILQYPSIPSVDPDKESSVLCSSNFAIESTSVGWLNAVSAGIWSGAERYTQQPTCPSGNCNWEEYSSTGWCSQCQDATSYAKMTDCTLNASTFDFDLIYNTDSCSVDLGHGSKLQVVGPVESSDFSDDGFTDSDFTLFREAVWPLNLLNWNLSLPLDNWTFAGVTNPILTLGHAYVQLCEYGVFEKGLCITSAEECVLSLCTRRVETSVVNGTTSIATIDEDFGCLSQIHEDNNEALHGTGTHCWQAGQSCADLEFFNLTSFRYENNLTSFGSETAFSLKPDFCSDGIIVQTNQWDNGQPLADIMASPNAQGKLLTRLVGNQTARWGFYGDFGEDDIIPSGPTMEYITANGLESVLAGVAASLTQYALLANTSEKVIGTVWTTETFVAVNWLWLIYPATLVLGSIVLLALTALHSHRCGLRIWKSSMLPLLYWTLDPDLLVRQPVLHDVSTMTEVAGKAKVTLVETSREDGVVLTQ